MVVEQLRNDSEVRGRRDDGDVRPKFSYARDAPVVGETAVVVCPAGAGAVSSFVNAAISDPSSAAIVRMVIDMARNLGFDVVAEGIETDQHVAFLRQHGCEQGQGYLFGKPVPAEEIAARLPRRA